MLLAVTGKETCRRDDVGVRGGDIGRSSRPPSKSKAGEGSTVREESSGNANLWLLSESCNLDDLSDELLTSSISCSCSSLPCVGVDPFESKDRRAISVSLVDGAIGKALNKDVIWDRIG